MKPLFLLLGAMINAPLFAAETPPSPVPGVVINHVPASRGIYIGSPGLAMLPNGDYVASHDEFGPKTTEHQSAVTHIFRSADKGQIWRKIATIEGAFWSTLFTHRGALYLLGTDRHHGNAVIRRSNDGGATWTQPKDAASGLLRDDGEYHCAPMPLLEHTGRLWRAFERRIPPEKWGVNYRAGMFSVPVDADLLNAANWTVSEFLPSERTWNNNDMGGWLEGNAVVAPNGELLDILRVQTTSPDEKAALVQVSADGKTLSFDPANGFVNFPGGAKKFTIRYDVKTQLYWALSSIVSDKHRATNPGGIRNTLALTASPDLKNWTIRCIVLYHPDVARHGFQYVEWLFDGEDIIAACRTAYDDGQGGAHNNHDANYLTFHRIANFRTKTMADAVPMPDLPLLRYQTRDFQIIGRDFTPKKLADGELAFSNRAYTWQNVPQQFADWNFTQLRGGLRSELRVKMQRDATLFIATMKSTATKPDGWNLVPNASFIYTDGGKTTLNIYARLANANEDIEIPQANWTGSMLLWQP